jgi:hypothetical protein
VGLGRRIESAAQRVIHAQLGLFLAVLVRIRRLWHRGHTLETRLIIPAFADFPKEAELVGGILSGYSVLEFWLMCCLRSVLHDDADTAIKVLYRTRGEEQSILIADALMRERFVKANLGGPYCEAIADMGWCRKIRNQYAHCFWDSPVFGEKRSHMVFVNLDDIGKQHVETVINNREVVDLKLLEEQTNYFIFVRRCLVHLHDEHEKMEGRSPTLDAPLPKKVVRPPPSNGRASPDTRTNGQSRSPSGSEPPAEGGTSAPAS